MLESEINKSMCWLCGNELIKESCDICLKVMSLREVKMIKFLGTLDYEEITDLRFKLDLKNLIYQLKILSIFMHGFILMIGLFLHDYLFILGTILVIYPSSYLIWKRIEKSS